MKICKLFFNKFLLICIKNRIISKQYISKKNFDEKSNLIHRKECYNDTIMIMNINTKIDNFYNIYLRLELVKWSGPIFISNSSNICQ